MLTRRNALFLTGGLLVFPAATLAQSPDVKEITHSPDQPVLGNPGGDVTLVEFFDYQCPYCRKVHGDVTDLVRQDGNIRLVMKDWPIFGETSIFAHKVGLAAVLLGKYAAVHDALMRLEGRRLSEDDIRDAARSVGVDAEAAATSFDQQADRWMPLLWRNEQQATELGLQGTPGFLAGRAVYPGAAPIDSLREMIANARSG